jgi:hypothetical protein
MLEINDVIKLKSSDSENKLSFATRYLVQVNYTFDLTVKSNSFSGTLHFCVRKDEIEELCSDLKKMMFSFASKAHLFDNDSDSFIDFNIDDSGRVFVNGQLGGSHEDNYMIFKFSSDKIATEYFIQELESLFNYIDDKLYELHYNYHFKRKK